MPDSRDMKKHAFADKKYVWHPFTQMADWVRENPLVIKSGRGVYLTDADGKKYIDGVSSLWVNTHGHRRKEIDLAIKTQLGRIAHTTFLGLTHAPAIELARRLVAIAPRGLSKVFYSDNGSTAVEIALKMAYQYWEQKAGAKAAGRPVRALFLSLKNAYHGDTIGSVSVGGMDLFHAKFKRLLFKTKFAPSPYCYRCPWKKNTFSKVPDMPAPAVVPAPKRLSGRYNKKFAAHCAEMRCGGQCIMAAARIFAEHRGKIAAAIVEPMVQAAAGILTMPPGYLTEFARLCRRAGALLIADEVATGFGRTGRMFACGIENIRPDFLCLAKGITGGYLPLAATLATEKIYRAFLGRYEEFKTFFHGHTYTANPLACAAAVANLEIFEKENTVGRCAAKSAALAAALERLKNSPFVGDVRRIGLMAGIEIVRDKKTGAMFAPGEKIAMKICARARGYGVILRPLGNIIVVLPPLAVTVGEIKKIVSAVEKSMNDTLRRRVFAKSVKRPSC